VAISVPSSLNVFVNLKRLLSMPLPRVLILRAPGTNCDLETAHAFRLAGAETVDSLHVNRLLEKPDCIGEYQILCIPGGFSYGDDVAAGRILGNQVRCHLAEAIRTFRDAGKLILGICNGFQALVKSGVLFDDAAESGPPATLAWNDSGRFTDRWVSVRTCGDRSPFLAGVESMYLPIAHAEGKFIAVDEPTMDRFDAAGQLALRYAARDGRTDDAPFPDNPNGSWRSVAGVCDASGRVLGLMPHPERHVDPTQHPRWTRGEAGKVGDGLRLFENAVAYFAN
jgi:phosphoribosylformylglycinamidine synthase